MDEKEILQRQVDALEKLLQIKEAIIQEQDSKIQKLEDEAPVNSFPQFPNVKLPHTYPQPHVNLPYISTTCDPCVVGGGPHEYPNPWLSTSSPQCKKCGKQATTGGYTITMTNDTNTKIK